ncbi:MAG: hypothetical protein LC650_02240 [Actinobacteria bacterium]|nr:hypothetical protein [Actinomycetota bacterium]
MTKLKFDLESYADPYSGGFDNTSMSSCDDGVTAGPYIVRVNTIKLAAERPGARQQLEAWLLDEASTCEGWHDEILANEPVVFVTTYYISTLPRLNWFLLKWGDCVVNSQ